jgi:hypothetical protein
MLRPLSVGSGSIFHVATSDMLRGRGGNLYSDQAGNVFSVPLFLSPYKYSYHHKYYAFQVHHLQVVQVLSDVD